MDQETVRATGFEDQTAALSQTLGMLAQMVNTVPDSDWVPSLATAVRALDPEAPGCARMQAFLDEHASDSTDELVRHLAVDWTLAFRGMNPAHGPRPPYAGAWLSDDGTGVDLMLAINTCYVEEGLGATGSHLNRFDYLGVELEFLAYLVEKAGSEQSDGTEISRAADFKRRYIDSWFSQYCEQVEQRCKTEFWKGYLELVAAVLADLFEELEKLAGPSES